MLHGPCSRPFNFHCVHWCKEQRCWEATSQDGQERMQVRIRKTGPPSSSGPATQPNLADTGRQLRTRQGPAQLLRLGLLISSSAGVSRSSAFTDSPTLPGGLLFLPFPWNPLPSGQESRYLAYFVSFLYAHLGFPWASQSQLCDLQMNLFCFWFWDCGAPGHKAFLCPSVSWLQKIGFLQPPWPSWVPMGRFKQLLIREGGDAETREKQSRNNSAALGRGPLSPSRSTQNNIFEQFYRDWNSHQVEVSCMLPISLWTSDQLEPQGWCCLPLTSSTNPSGKCPWADHSLLFEPW